MGVFGNLEALQTCSLGIFIQDSLHWHDQLLTQFPAHLSFPEDGDGVESSKLLIMA